MFAQSSHGLPDIIQTVAGSGPPSPGPDGGYAGDGGPATSALLNQPYRLAFVTVPKGVLQPGDLLVTDFYNDAVRRVAASDGTITSLLRGLTGLRNEPQGLALDAAGNVWIGGLDSILKFDPDTGALSREVTLEGIHRANDLEFDEAGNLLIADTNFGKVYMLPAGTPTPIAEASLPVVAGVGLHEPTCVHQSNGRVYICDAGHHRIVRVENGILSAIPALPVVTPHGIASDGVGHLFIADTGLDQILAYDPVTEATFPIAGTGTEGFTGDHLQPATTASLFQPAGVEFGPDGRLYLTDASNERVRAIGTPTPTTVGIDIKPGSFPNSINLSSGGVVPVAILSTATFDASRVDPFSATLADALARIKGKSGHSGSLEDVDNDGDLDLVLHVISSELHLTGSDVEAVLTGSTLDGTPIRGSDSVKIVPD